MFYLRFLFSAWMILFLCFGSQAQFLKSSESAYSSGHYVATDHNDDLYVAGEFVCEIAIDTFLISSTDCENREDTEGEVSQMPPNMFIFKSNQQGEVLWAVGTDLNDNTDVYELKGIAPMGTAGMIAAGTYEQNFNIGGDSASTTAEKDMFITHVGIDGVVNSLLSGFTTSDTSSIVVNGVVSGNANNAVIYGEFLGDIEINGTAYYSATPKLFAIEVASDMSVSLKAIGEDTTYDGDIEGTTAVHDITSETNITAAAVLSDQSLLLTISADNLTAVSTDAGTTEMGTGATVDDGNGNMVWQSEVTKNLVKIASDGTLTVLNDNLGNLPFVIKERNNGNYLLAANYEDAGQHLVIREFNTSGVMQWEKFLSTADVSLKITGKSLSIDENDNFYLAGRFGDNTSTGSFSVDGDLYSAVDGEDGFVIKFLVDKTIEYVQLAGTDGDDQMNDLAVIDERNVIGTGFFTTETTMGTRTIENLVGTGNMFWGVIDPYPGFEASFTMEAQEVCVGTEVLLTALDDPNYAYQWQRDSVDIANAVSSQYTATEPGSYRVLITDNTLSYTKTTNALELIVNPLPNPSITNEDASEICAGSSAFLNGSGNTSSTYQWYLNDAPIDGATTNSLLANVTGTYYLKETSAEGCSNVSGVIDLDVIDYPGVYDIAIDGEVPFCDGSSVTLSIPDNETDVSYQWYIGDVPIEGETNLQLEAFEEGNYHYTVSSNKANCVSVSGSVELVVNDSPPANISSNDGNMLCEGGSMNLVANSGYGLTHQWYKDGEPLTGEDTNILRVSQAGVYVVEVGFEGACSRASDPFEVVVNPVPSAVITSNGENEICDGTTTFLTANEAPENETYSYQWLRNNNPIAGEEAISFEATEGGDYKVVVTNEFNCQSVSESKQIRLLSSPTADLLVDGTDNTFCKGEMLTLYTQSQSDYTYQWQKDGSLIADNTSPSLDAVESGNYAVRVTNTINNCATLSDEVQLEALDAPNETIVMNGESNSICDRDSAQLSVTDNAEWNYQWIREDTYLNADTGHALKIKNGGNYQVEITNAAGCKSVTQPIDITLKDNSKPHVLQEGLFLSTQSYYSLNWNLDGVPLQGQENQVLLVEESGDYSVTVIHENGCQSTSESITVCNPVPEITTEGSVLKASHGTIFQWFYDEEPIYGATRQTYQAQLSGQYSVLVTDAGGCQSMSEATLVCVPAPTITLREEDSVLVASSGLDYQWYLDGEILDDADTRIYVPKSDGNFTVLVTNVYGCTSMSKSFEIVYDTSIKLSTAEKDIYVYPNPVENSLFVTTGSKPTQHLRLTFFNTQGKKSLEKDFNQPGNEVSIDMSALDQGIYLMKYETDTQYGVISVVKQ
jgi:hypothetical protein